VVSAHKPRFAACPVEGLVSRIQMYKVCAQSRRIADVLLRTRTHARVQDRRVRKTTRRHDAGGEDNHVPNGVIAKGEAARRIAIVAEKAAPGMDLLSERQLPMCCLDSMNNCVDHYMEQCRSHILEILHSVSAIPISSPPQDTPTAGPRRPRRRPCGSARAPARTRLARGLRWERRERIDEEL